MYAIAIVLVAIVWAVYNVIELLLKRKHELEDRNASSLANDAEVLKLRAELEDVNRRLRSLESSASARALTRR